MKGQLTRHNLGIMQAWVREGTSPSPTGMKGGLGMLPKRKAVRLKGFDYGTPGVYFITICTHERQCTLSAIDEMGKVLLTASGRIVAEEIRNISSRWTSVSVDKYVIMPNHIHMILTLCETGAGASVTGAIGAMKSIATNRSGIKLFQRSFHDHVIRTESDYRMIWKYIDTNPLKWAQDCFYQPEGSHIKANPAPEKGVPSPCGE